MEEKKYRVLYSILIHLFSTYPYLPSWINVKELSKELKIPNEDLKEELEELKRKALAEMEKQRRTREEQWQKYWEREIYFSHY
jgi:AAA+ ATPase superfamily predicted ATPase